MTADPDLDGVLRLVGDRTGLQFPDYRRDTVDRAVRKEMAGRRAPTPSDYLTLLRGDPAAFGGLLDRLTVGETYFFREPAQFDQIRQTVLPDVLDRKKPGERVRVWSAGCSTGEEAYSLAVVLLEAGLDRRADVVATDLSPDALTRAARGEYGSWSVRNDGGRRITPYFLARGSARVIDDRVRRLVRFKVLNLADPVYPATVVGPPGRDLILCRNVLIYFDSTSVAAVARRLFDALAPGGWLVTASCDPPLAGHAPFVLVTTPAGIVYRRDTGAFTPKGWESSAQGEALGFRRRADFQPEGLGPAGVSQPFRPGTFTAPEPRASPWAKDSHPFGVKTEARIQDRAAPADADWLREIRDLADRDPAAAEVICATAARRSPLSAELRLTHAVLLLGLGRLPEAVRATRGALFLAPDASVGHHTLGLLLAKTGDRSAAERAFRRARELAASAPAGEPIRFGRGETAGDMVRAADIQLAHLARAGGGP